MFQDIAEDLQTDCKSEDRLDKAFWYDLWRGQSNNSHDESKVNEYRIQGVKFVIILLSFGQIRKNNSDCE